MKRRCPTEVAILLLLLSERTDPTTYSPPQCTLIHTIHGTARKFVIDDCKQINGRLVDETRSVTRSETPMSPFVLSASGLHLHLTFVFSSVPTVHGSLPPCV